MNLKKMELYIFPLENLHCGYGKQQGVVLPSLSSIAGRVIRGGLAGWAIRNGKLNNKDKDFTALFYPNDIDNTISYPWCTYKGRLPAPMSLFSAEVMKEDPHQLCVKTSGGRYIYKKKEIKHEAIPVNPVDFLNRDSWPAKMQQSFKPYRGTVGENGFKCYNSFRTGLEMKSGHDKESGRVEKDGDSGLRVEEVMPASDWHEPESIYYQGTLSFKENSEIEKIFKGLWEKNLSLPEKASLHDPDPGNLIFIGRKKIPAVIYAEEPKSVTAIGEEYISNKPLTLTLTTDAIFTPPYDKYTINGDLFLKEFELDYELNSRSFCRGGQLHGFDHVKGKPKTWPTISAGSCIKLNMTGKSEDDQKTLLAKLEELSYLGVGQHRRDGCGRFKINWELHNITGGEDEKNNQN